MILKFLVDINVYKEYYLRTCAPPYSGLYGIYDQESILSFTKKRKNNSEDVEENKVKRLSYVIHQMMHRLSILKILIDWLIHTTFSPIARILKERYSKT